MYTHATTATRRPTDRTRALVGVPAAVALALAPLHDALWGTWWVPVLAAAATLTALWATPPTTEGA